MARIDTGAAHTFMAAKLLVITFSLTQLTDIVLSQNTCDPSYTLWNFCLRDLIIKTVDASTSQECLSKCSLENTCRSINHHESKSKCDLNKGSHLSHPEALIPSEGVTYVQGSVNVSRDKYCSDKYCSETLVCVMKEQTDYECVPCEVSGRTEVLDFQRKSSQDKVEWEHPFQNSLTAFTVSLWVKIDPATSFHSAFSYAVVGRDNEVCVHFSSATTRIIIRNSMVDKSMPYIDNQWHHVALTWQSSDGKWILYGDGVEKFTGNIQTGQTVDKGAIILGQDADSYMGGYDSSQALQGKLTLVNLWDRVLTTQEISDIFNKKCSSIQGNIVAWKELVKRRSGQVKSLCPSSCTV